MNFCTNMSVSKPGVRSAQGVCVAQNTRAAGIGAEILANGGSAFDAAVAVSFALGVLEPWMSGIGGGGGLLFRDGASDAVQTIDFGLVAPAGLDPDIYRLEPGYSNDMFPWRNVQENRNSSGIHSVATPGVIAGMGRLHAHGGRMPWRDLLAPAIELAREGVRSDWYAQVFVSTCMGKLRDDPALCQTFLPGGLPPAAAGLAAGQAGWRLSALADTLEQLAHCGWEDFYCGDLATSIASEVRDAGGSLGLSDLGAYEAHQNAAQSTAFRDAKVFLSPGLSSGKALARALELMPVTDSLGGVWFAEMAQALHQAQSERWREDGDGAGDDATVPKATDHDGTGKPVDCTTHFAVSDGQGNLISVTQTILSAFGAGVMLPKTGIILNNGMMWFDPEPGKPNSIAPGKRCLMNFAPTILNQGEAWSAIGAAGGRRILSAVAQLIGFMVDHGRDGQAALQAPRMDCSIAGKVTVPQELADLAEIGAKGLDLAVAPALPWPLTYAIPSVLSVGSAGSTGYADPVSPWSGAVAPQGKNVRNTR
ncbi:gamma-glutamyltransferase [Rhodobacteraceae bacterium D3-12]|nr:gamma-glutamyltransferase [Rhodobacteraceae bacterium D3-12]